MFLLAKHIFLQNQYPLQSSISGMLGGCRCYHPPPIHVGERFSRVWHHTPTSRDLLSPHTHTPTGPEMSNLTRDQGSGFNLTALLRWASAWLLSIKTSYLGPLLPCFSLRERFSYQFPQSLWRILYYHQRNEGHISKELPSDYLLPHCPCHKNRLASTMS